MTETTPDGTPWQCASGRQFMMFENYYCNRCKLDPPPEEPMCEVAAKAFVGIQPDEWVYKNGKAFCTKFDLIQEAAE